MPETTTTPESEENPAAENSAASAKSHFTKAMEEAKAGAQALGKEAKGRADEYREKLHEAGGEWSSQAREKSGEAREKAQEFANEGKSRASKAMSGLGKFVEDQGSAIDDAVSPKYGEYARSAGKSIQETAAKLDEKSFEEMGEDAKEFVRKSPALAVGMAAAAGFLFARMFSRK